MTICIAGKNNIAINVCEYVIQNFPEYHICALTNQTDHGIDSFQRSYLKYAKEKKLPIVLLDDIYEINELILISLEFDKLIVPSKCRSDARLYNIHFSLLPEYKGQFTSALPILHGKEYTGVTFHEIEKGVDTGNIIAQKKLTITSNETARSLYHKYIKEGTDLVISNLSNIIDCNYSAYPQPIQGSSFYSIKSIDYSNLQINTKCSAYQLDQQIRAFNFREYQLPTFLGSKIVATTFTKEKSIFKSGHIIEETDDTITLSTIDYNIILIKDRFDYLLDLTRNGETDILKSYKYLSNYLFDKETQHGWTLLMVAAYNNHYDLVKYLVECGADVNDMNYNGTSVIMYAKDCAIIHNDKRIYLYLISQGADLSHKDFRGFTLKDYVQDYKNYFPELFI